MNIEEIKIYAEKYGVPIMRPETSRLIENFVNEAQPKNILEIGTAIGYSGIVMLNSSKAKLVTIEHNKQYIIKAKKNFADNKLNSRVKILDMDCMVALANMASNKKYSEYFDLIFLDGPKTQYEKMLELLLILLKKNGTLIVDDVLFHKKENMPLSKRFRTIETRMNSFIEKCKNSQKFSIFTLNPVEDGVIFAEKG